MEKKAIISKGVSFLSRFVRPGKIVSFCSYPDFTDNPYAVFVKMISDTRFKEYKFVWMLNQEDNYEANKQRILNIYPSVVVIRKSSLAGFWVLLKSRFHICSHGLNKNLWFHQQKPKVINLWHGMPLKVIGALDPVYGATYENSDVVLATNEFYQEVMSKAFLLDKSKVKVLGYPRNDLFQEDTDFFNIYNVKREDYSSIGAWLPTFHKNAYTEDRVDGVYEEGKIEFFNVDKLQELDKDMQKRKNLLVIKLHPMDAANSFEFPKFKNILVVNSKSPSFQLYPFLGKCDYLLTDFSSVFIDFDVLSRPMGFVFSDLSEYKKNRGFIVDDVEAFLPGNIISSYDQFLDFVDNYKEKTIDTKDKYNIYKDNNASVRVIDYLYSTIHNE